MTRARGWAAACFAASAVVATWPGTADADAPQAAAYWMRSNPAAAAPAAAPNPAVPDGGLFVDNDPSTEAPTATPAAFGAVRFQIPEGATGKLTLKMAPSSASTPQTVALSACPTTSPWSAPPAGGPGPYDQAPTYTTSAAACVVGAASPNATSYTFTLGHEQEGRPGVFDLAIVPTPGAQPVPFTLVFNKPDDTALALDPMPSGDTNGSVQEPAAPEEPAPDPVVDPLPVTSTPDLGAATPVFSAPSFSQSALGAAPIVSAPATPAAPPAAPAATKAAPSKPAATVPAVHVSDKQWQRLMAVSLLLTMAGALWYFGGQAARAPRLLGSVGSGDLTAAAIPTVAPARAGGIGRFNKPRSAPPRRLR